MPKVPAMIGADLALAGLINRCATAYETNMPPYMTFEEHTHIVANAPPFIHIDKNVNRAVAVRTKDAFAVMQDLPQGKQRTGSAFPVPPAFDPFSSFWLQWFVNFGSIDIDYFPGDPFTLTIPADTSVDALVPYFSEWTPRFAPDSSDAAPHILLDPTSRWGSNDYVSDVQVDPVTQLPSHVTLQIPDKRGSISIGLDYQMVQGHWIVTHGTLDSAVRVGVTIKGHAETTFTNFAFPSSPPDPQLAGTPRPSPTPTTTTAPSSDTSSPTPPSQSRRE